MSESKRMKVGDPPGSGSGTKDDSSGSIHAKPLSVSAAHGTLLTLRLRNEEVGVSLSSSDLLVFGRKAAEGDSVQQVQLPAHVEAMGLQRKAFSTGDKFQSRCHAFLWHANGKVCIRPVETDGPPKHRLLFSRKNADGNLDWSEVFQAGVTRPTDPTGDFVLPLDADYLTVTDDEKSFLRIEWKYNELLCFACSPTISRIEQAGSEIVAVRDRCQWGHTVELHFGGTQRTFQEALCKPTRRFLFSGHADAAADGSTTKTIGFTLPGGGLAGLPPAAAIASALCKVSITDGGLLELVFINGCDSEALGRQIWKQGTGVPTVLCWKTPTCDPAAKLFCVHFFECIAGGGESKTAFETAAMAIVNEMHKGRPKFRLEGPGAPPFAQPWASGMPLLLNADGRAWTVQSDGTPILDTP